MGLNERFSLFGKQRSKTICAKRYQLYRNKDLLQKAGLRPAFCKRSKAFRGYIARKRRYFCELRSYIVVAEYGMPVSTLLDNKQWGNRLNRERIEVECTEK